MLSKQEKIDRRVERTIKSLRTALLELIHEKHYDSITVQDIIDRANVGRSTFYTHFRDKEDVLVGDWKRLLDMIVEHIALDRAAEDRFLPVLELMGHLKDFHSLYRALAKSGKNERLFNVGTAYLAEGIEKKLLAIEASGGQLSVPADVCASYLAVQMFASLRWWLDHNMPYTPTEMDRMFHELVGPGIRQVLGMTPKTLVMARSSSIY